ncbi:hypothetical protein QL285_045891 [Trifolium repens]|nr:hypothetical protein QL285_045891 [Trifolium repens]
MVISSRSSPNSCSSSSSSILSIPRLRLLRGGTFTAFSASNSTPFPPDLILLDAVLTSSLKSSSLTLEVAALALKLLGYDPMTMVA